MSAVLGSATRAAGAPAAGPFDATRTLRLVWADVLERTRKPGYLVSLLVMVWIAQHMLPVNGSPYRTFVMDDHFRPAYNAAWVGTLTALLTGMWHLFVGFYLVKGSVERDRRTGVGQILAATPLRTLGYVWARTLGNLAVFATQTAVVAVVALAQQQLLGEDRRVDLLATLTPYLAITLPLALFAAATAVLFDCSRWLRGGLGNIVWFFLLALMLAGGDPDQPRGKGNDFAGTRVVTEDVRATLAAAHPETAGRPRAFSMGVVFNPNYRTVQLQTFEWRGVRWSLAHVLDRMPYLLLALSLVWLAAFVFDRFDTPARAPAAPRAKWGRAKAVPAAVSAPRSVHAGALAVARRGFAPWRIVRAELALMLKGLSPWWWLMFVGFLVAEVFVPLEPMRKFVLPVASFWPALLWSPLGTRERRHDTGAVLFSCPDPVARLLPAAWFAGAVVMLLAGAPALVRFAVAGESAALLGWLLGAALVPAFAFACGVWSRSSKLFEVLFLMVWYVGPMHQLAELDYTGATAQRSPHLWLVYGALTMAALVAGWAGRQAEMRR